MKNVDYIQNALFRALALLVVVLALFVVSLAIADNRPAGSRIPGPQQKQVFINNVTS
jgi:hypothetical protein